MPADTHYMVEMVVKIGKFDEFTALMEEMVASAKNEPGTLDYEWFVAGDRRTVLIHERYRDVEAAAVHSAKFSSDFRERFMDLAKPGKFLFLGEPSPERRKRVKTDVHVLKDLGGFTRHDL
jgi:quinol monooxygenase YgiN